MKCKECGKEYEDSMNFCPRCGEKKPNISPEPTEKMASREPSPIQGDAGLTACCTYQSAELTLKTDPSQISGELQRELEGNLGTLLSWQDTAENTEINIRIVRIDAGSRAKRYLLPFIAPAIMEAEGDLSIRGASSQPFHFVERADFGLFGGSDLEMLSRLTKRLAKDIAMAIRNSTGVLPQAAASPQGYPIPSARRPGAVDGMCVASMVLGILSILFSALFGVGIVLGILAIVFYKLGRDKIAQDHLLKGRGMGIAGLVCGLIGTPLSILYLVLIIT